ncbi:MAG: hypothetical protein BIFFINMI_03164 [Phycisphaerae bacterium]|nr:hypothetical protein [Phycisphaerae bacterium]
MPVDRPTFSESWYRVADLRPRLRGTVQSFRQHYRGRMWQVLQDPGSNQFFRLNESAYRFVALLDGRRTVAEVWDLCNDRLGDEAPTQNEAIQLLGQLYVNNLIAAELPPDAAGLFERYHKRVTREVRGYLMNFLFVRIPLLDPDHFLKRWVGLFGRLFTRTGFVLWLALMGAGLYFVLPRFGELTSQTMQFFSRQNLLGNLPLLYATIVGLKVLHEFGHAFACKWFGRDGGGGEVHAMGVMFLVFTPLPYVDASSAWAFRSKWRRIVVSAAGMYVEMAVAAVAAIVWARTIPGSTINTVAYNAIFIASVSTLLFNANPLLRYDGYYILSDWLEMPNLQQRSRQYLYYLVRRWVWSVRRAPDPSHSRGEKAWLVVYAVASTIYRVFICVAILLFIAARFLMLGVALALAAAVAWVLVPLGKFAHYLLTHQELSRTRGRAVFTALLAAAAIYVGVGAIRMPDRTRVDGVWEPEELSVIYVAEDGTADKVLPDGAAVSPDGPPLLISESPEVQADLAGIDADLAYLQAYAGLTWLQERQTGESQESVRQQVQRQREALIDGQQKLARDREARLTIHAPRTGVWLSPDADALQGARLLRGQELGKVAGTDRFIIRAWADPSEAARIQDADPRVEIRVQGRPDLKLTGRLDRMLPAGQEQLPSAALGYAAGGSIMTAPGDKEGTRALQRGFELRIVPDDESIRRLCDETGRPVALRSGQRVVVRFQNPPKPLARQWWRTLRQMFQEKAAQ